MTMTANELRYNLLALLIVEREPKNLDDVVKEADKLAKWVLSGELPQEVDLDLEMDEVQDEEEPTSGFGSGEIP